MGTGELPRVALVHDFLLDLRGAERVFLRLCEMYPDADIFTAVYDKDGTEDRFHGRRIHTSFVQKLRPDSRSFRRYLPLYPYAMELLDLRGYDLVLSSSSAWAHGVIPGEDAIHVCYCHNPFRYAWAERQATLDARPLPVRIPLGIVLSRWRGWDWMAAQHVDRYVANSEATKRRIARNFGRESEVVYPPVDVDRFTPGLASDRFVVLSELMAHKRIDLAVRACTRLGLPLTVIGDGPDSKRLIALAGPTVEFTGRIGDIEVAQRLSAAKAMIVAANEEFGIAAVEAQASGLPVLAYRAGGVLETVVDGRTGAFFDEASVDCLTEALSNFDARAYDPLECVANARRFSNEQFASNLRNEIALALTAGSGDRKDVRRGAVRGLAIAGRRVA